MDRDAFLAETNARMNLPRIPDLGQNPMTSFTLGNLTFKSSGGFYMGGITQTVLLPGNEIAINGLENLDVFIARPVTAFGFDFAEPTDDPIDPDHVESTFEVTLLLGVTEVGTVQFVPAMDKALFYGISSDGEFDAVEIREIVGGIENEYFGEFYLDTDPVPAVSTWGLTVMVLLLLSAGTLVMSRRRPVTM